MKVNGKMIDKQLRFRGRLFRLLLRPTKRSFKMINWIQKQSIGKDIKGLDCSEVYIPSRDHDRTIRVRTYKPESIDKPLPGLLMLHGGGYAIGNPEMDHPMIEEFIKAKECVIVAPHYRISLDEGYPAALYDSYDALRWMIENSDELHIDTTKIIVGGWSAGGGLTTSITLMARDLGDVNIALQMPIYPMIDYRNNTESARDNNAPIWNQKHNKLGWDLYIGHLAESEINSYVSPALNQNYKDLPPAITIVGDLDPFRDETVDYFEKLKAAGVEATYKVFPHAYHGFDVIVWNAKVSQDARKFLLDHYSDAVEKYSSPQP